MRDFNYCVSRTRWSLLKSGKEQVIPQEILRTITGGFDVNSKYLIEEDGPFPEQVQAIWSCCATCVWPRCATSPPLRQAHGPGHAEGDH
ncbi:hypothetical protein [Arthrobacter sp. MDT1-65]